MELSRNHFPMHAPVWKTKIRKIAANLAKHRQKTHRVVRESSALVSC
jgi:hypothetical protein